MILRIQRLKLLADCTIGGLYFDDSLEYFTLEDKIREVSGQPVESWKIAKVTAIPAGSYNLVIDLSTRFKREMPHILDVPGFSGIRIHAGNTADDTEGCPILGYSASVLGNVSQSTAAMFSFMERLEKSLKTESVTIQIVNP